MKEKKPRKDAKLKTLPEVRQAQIEEYGRDHGVDDIVMWLGKAGLETSTAAVSDFLAWRRLGHRLERNQGKVERALDVLRAKRPGMAEEEIQAAGYVLFSEIAMDEEDPEVWKMANDTRAKQKALDLLREKFEFDAAKACLAALPDLKVISANSGLDERGKIEQIRLRLFGEELPGEKAETLKS